ncbi:hypothetical protein TEA_002977 [Camellia sinensis var. sinensis]|uniref:GST N-terminal domain-containing protein n=1 Tax=Camellia sinensis var. sinensis TaxID=542762 RepID=A0A4S4DCX7_CAMSN|nr:hypothetical protein TEA_002977 [Camellia sinensis var. sinensis]
MKAFDMLTYGGVGQRSPDSWPPYPAALPGSPQNDVVLGANFQKKKELHWAEECLKREKDRVAHYLHSSSELKLLEHKDVTMRPAEETPEITPTVDEAVLSPVNQDTITPLPSESDTMEPKEMLLSDEEKERNSAEEEKLEESPIDEEAAHNSSVVPAVSIAVRQFGCFLRELSHSTQSAAAVAASIAELCIILAFGRVGGDVKEVLPPVLDSSSNPPPLFDGTTRLYTSYICPYAQHVWIARNYKGLQEKIKLVPIDLQNRPDWYKEKVPSLEHNNEIRGESLDLLKYIDSYFEGPALYPDDPTKREFAEELLSYTSTFNLAVITSLKGGSENEIKALHRSDSENGMLMGIKVTSKLYVKGEINTIYYLTR